MTMVKPGCMKLKFKFVKNKSKSNQCSAHQFVKPDDFDDSFIEHKEEWLSDIDCHEDDYNEFDGNNDRNVMDAGSDTNIMSSNNNICSVDDGRNVTYGGTDNVPGENQWNIDVVVKREPVTADDINDVGDGMTYSNDSYDSVNTESSISKIHIKKELINSEVDDNVINDDDDTTDSTNADSHNPDMVIKEEQLYSDIPINKVIVKVLDEDQNTEKPLIDLHSMSKCIVCFKAFLNEDTYNEHMKRHTNKSCSSSGKMSSITPTRYSNSVPKDYSVIKMQVVRSNSTKKLIEPRKSNRQCNSKYKKNGTNGLVIQIPTTGYKRRLSNNSKMAPQRASTTDEFENGTRDLTRTIDKTKRKKYLKNEYGTRRPFSCDKCDYKSARKDYLKRHVLIHSEKKPFACSYCEYTCVQLSHLRQHVRTHTKDKPFACSYCAYRCVQRSHLDQHTRVHTREKPFSCSYCAYRCVQRSHLVQHMRTHTHEKPFSCSYCAYRCVQRSHLVQHVRTHTHEKPFSCSHCEFRCSQQASLDQHERRHTGRTLHGRNKRTKSTSTCNTT